MLYTSLEGPIQGDGALTMRLVRQMGDEILTMLIEKQALLLRLDYSIL